MLQATVKFNKMKKERTLLLGYVYSSYIVFGFVLCLFIGLISLCTCLLSSSEED